MCGRRRDGVAAAAAAAGEGEVVEGTGKGAAAEGDFGSGGALLAAVGGAAAPTRARWEHESYSAAQEPSHAAVVAAKYGAGSAQATEAAEIQYERDLQLLTEQMCHTGSGSGGCFTSHAS